MTFRLTCNTKNIKNTKLYIYGPIFFVLMLVLNLVYAQPQINNKALLLVNAAQSQIGVTTSYDGSYQRLAYPNGDVAANTGVCTDVIIRAYRKVGLDLQVLVHEDMKKNWSRYPKIWGSKKTDSNIDHRRVPNLAAFFTQKKSSLPITNEPNDYKPGDIVTWMLPRNLPHIGIVSARKQNGRPLMIHNIGLGAKEDDMLFSFKITGHYRYHQK